MKLLIDMNLSPLWVPWLAARGVSSTHWSDVGAPDAPDAVLFAYAGTDGFVVFTHDLDFGNLLAATGAARPSVIQVRVQDPFPDTVGDLLPDALARFERELDSGALVVVEPHRQRVRLLPIT